MDPSKEGYNDNQIKKLQRKQLQTGDIPNYSPRFLRYMFVIKYNSKNSDNIFYKSITPLLFILYQIYRFMTHELKYIVCGLDPVFCLSVQRYLFLSALFCLKVAYIINKCNVQCLLVKYFNNHFLYFTR